MQILKENIQKINKSICKRISDVFLSLVFLITLVPLWPLLVLAIRSDSKGNALFRQQRIGRNGKPFVLYKLRTMVADAEQQKPQLLKQHNMQGPIFKTPDDPRVTKIGRLLRRTSLDELPQFFNVLKGDMSIVGPRPHIQAEVDLYTPEQHGRLAIKPGITCTWQVSKRDLYTFDEWIQLDLEYIKQWSCLKDFSLIAKTVTVVFKADGY